MRRIAIAALTLLLPQITFAGVLVYTGLSSEKVTIEDAPKLGTSLAVMQLDGVESAWAGKPFQVKRETNTNGDRYSFEYDLELSSGIQKRHYQIIVGTGYELKNGSRVKKIELYYPEMPDHKPVDLVYDEAASKSAQAADLIGKLKKTPFKPDVD